MLTHVDIEFMERMQREYESLAQRWRDAPAYSQEVANLHATFKAREHEIGQRVSGGLFARVLSHISANGVTEARHQTFGPKDANDSPGVKS